MTPRFLALLAAATFLAGCDKGTQTTETLPIQTPPAATPAPAPATNAVPTDPDMTTTESGLQYKALKQGTGTESPKPTSTVTVHYHGTFLNGKVFDSSVNRGQPASFPLDAVIPGWTEGLQLMKVGDKFKFIIPPPLAYGPGGRPGIPPNSTLVFEVELLEIK